MKMSPKAQTHVAPAAPELPPSPIYANPSDLLNVDSTFMLSRSNIHTTSDPLLKTKNSLTDIFRQCNSLHKQHMKFKKQLTRSKKRMARELSHCREEILDARQTNKIIQDKFENENPGTPPI